MWRHLVYQTLRRSNYQLRYQMPSSSKSITVKTFYVPVPGKASNSGPGNISDRINGLPEKNVKVKMGAPKIDM